MSTSRIIGADIIRANLLAFPEELAKKALAQALMKGAQPMVAAAEALAPKDTGTMAASIRAAYDKKPRLAGMDARVVVFVPYKGPKAALYWRYVEFGTSKQPPHPFMRPAFESNAQTSLQIIFQSLSDAIPRIAASLKK